MDLLGLKEHDEKFGAMDQQFRESRGLEGHGRPSVLLPPVERVRFRRHLKT